MNRFIVLTYHRVTGQPDPLRPQQCHAALFRSQLAVLRRFFSVLPLDEALARQASGTLPGRCVCISFDDGYRDNHDVALPMLKAAGLPATFFIASGYLDGGMMWNDRVIEAVRGRAAGPWPLDAVGLGEALVGDHASRRELIVRLIGALKYRPQQERDALSAALLAASAERPPARLMMNPDEVRALAAAGMDIGGHTITHPILNEIDDAQAQAELTGGREALAEITGGEIALFAYPNGKPQRDYSARHAQFARDAGFKAAFSTEWGYVGGNSSRFELPRVGFETEAGWRFGGRIARAFLQAPATSRVATG